MAYQSTFDDPGYCEEYGKRVSNAGNPEVGPETFGTVTEKGHMSLLRRNVAT